MRQRLQIWLWPSDRVKDEEKETVKRRKTERKKGGTKSEILLFPSNLFTFCSGRSWIAETSKWPLESVRIFIISS
jgi:hypothetical protein